MDSLKTDPVSEVSFPRFLYGTAWKEETTKHLVTTALQEGFRGIDTANQRRHYAEAAVGEALQAIFESGTLDRENLFLQTKFTFQASQDHRLPYDPQGTITRQVEQSFASSLEHLRIDQIDSYLLHGPMTRKGLTTVDWEAWRAMEMIQESGRVRFLGVSNFSLEQLEILWKQSRIKPQFVQNRCYATTGWDRSIRQFCSSKGIIYQGFSLLTANRNLLSHPEILRIAQRYQRTSSQIIFRFAIQVGMMPLTGTTNRDHMQDDLAIFQFELAPGEVRTIEMLGNPTLT